MSIVGVLFEKLVHLIQSNTELIAAVLRDDPIKILNNIDTLKAFMQEQHNLEENNHEEIAELLVFKIRDLVTGTENYIDYFITCTTQYRKGRFPKRLPDTVAGLALDIRRAVKNIETLTGVVNKFYQNKVELDVESLEEIQLLNRSSTTNMDFMVEEDKVVGFENQLQEVIQLLRGGDVVSITGMAGLGKTTLAKMVFNDPQIEQKFYRRSFVSVSRDYSQKNVLMKIAADLFEMRNPLLSSMPEDELVGAVRRNFDKGNYLIILDDIWDLKAWDDLRVAFPNNERSRVLITTQNNAVAEQASPKSHQYCLRSLDTVESQELLRREVFGDNSCPRDLEEYELQILQRCNGVPLRVLLVAGILLSERDEIHWWKKVAELVDHHVTVVDHYQSVLDMVELSFDRLPGLLKHCFLYLGAFPEYFQIPVWKLLLLWIAEGFIEQDENLSLEDIADGYLEDLIHRNLVMVGEKRSDGRNKTCHIHPVVGEFCKKRGAERNLFKEIKRSETSFPNCHRLCINSYLFDWLSRISSNKSILSFLSFDQEGLIMSPDMMLPFAKSFKIIRVLDVKPIAFPHFPLELLDLTRLKYLAISGCFRVLPKNLSCLSSLQTLIVEIKSFLTLEIEADILKMAHLRHLHTNVSTHLKDDEAEPFTNGCLQTLSLISPETCKGQVLQRTPGLKKLGVRGKVDILLDANNKCSPWLDNISMLEIQNLKLLNDGGTSRLYSFHGELSFPSKLTKLTLFNTALDWRHMVTLGKLENLEVLQLKTKAFQGNVWETKDGGFRRLKVLQIGSTNFISWRALASHFPMLTSLCIRDCTKLTAIPSNFADIPSFQKIDLYHPSRLLASSAREIQEKKLKIQAHQRTNKNGGFKLSVFSSR